MKHFINILSHIHAHCLGIYLLFVKLPTQVFNLTFKIPFDKFENLKKSTTYSLLLNLMSACPFKRQGKTKIFNMWSYVSMYLWAIITWWGLGINNWMWTRDAKHDATFKSLEKISSHCLNMHKCQSSGDLRAKAAYVVKITSLEKMCRKFV